MTELIEFNNLSHPHTSVIETMRFIIERMHSQINYSKRSIKKIIILNIFFRKNHFSRAYEHLT